MVDLNSRMQYTKIQSWSFLGSGEEDFRCFSLYMGIAAILLNDAKPFEQIDNPLLTEGPMWNLVKIGQAVSVSAYNILYM